ncbi:hypothetical protein [Pontibacter sp. G13]|uniref:hypothetical protein n=1 Tax=Pontibacter sp. G13 TaxID=3074898 RepID=UPI00288BE19E|nr:hypothetical protein [Pontibacter sp. G13]WNJ18571.1 hypothetical protein RJD25_27260 [Pontibacter sp. G13]
MGYSLIIEMGDEALSLASLPVVFSEAILFEGSVRLCQILNSSEYETIFPSYFCFNSKSSLPTTDPIPGESELEDPATERKPESFLQVLDKIWKHLDTRLVPPDDREDLYYSFTLLESFCQQASDMGKRIRWYFV